MSEAVSEAMSSEKYEPSVEATPSPPSENETAPVEGSLDAPPPPPDGGYGWVQVFVGQYEPPSLDHDGNR